MTNDSHLSNSVGTLS